MEPQNIVVGVLSLGILIILFSSLQSSDVSSMNGILRRRLPSSIVEGYGYSEQASFKLSLSETWIAQHAAPGEEDSDGRADVTRDEKNENIQQPEETCDVNPAPRGVYVKGHVAQWKQPHNPRKAVYGDDWDATAKAYPHTARQAQQIVDELNTKTELPVSTEWSDKHPYVRLCVPTACGLSKKSGCKLQEKDFLMHINPNHKDTDNTTHLFYKGFVRNGHLMLPNVGLTGH